MLPTGEEPPLTRAGHFLRVGEAFLEGRVLAHDAVRVLAKLNLLLGVAQVRCPAGRSRNSRSSSPIPARRHQLRASMRAGGDPGQMGAGRSPMGTLPLRHSRPRSTPSSHRGAGCQAGRGASLSESGTPGVPSPPRSKPRAGRAIPTRAAPHRGGQEIARRSLGRCAHRPARPGRPGRHQGPPSSSEATPGTLPERGRSDNPSLAASRRAALPSPPVPTSFESR